MKLLKLLKFKVIASVLMLAFTTMAFGQTVSVVKVDQVYQNVKEIEVDASFASVNVTGSERTDVNLAAEIFSDTKTQDVTIKRSLNGDKLKISVETNDGWFNRGNYKGVINLQVPKNLRLSISSVSGDVMIDQSFGELDASTVSGSVSGSNIKGKVKASSVSGAVRFKNVSDLIAKGKFSSVSGEVELENVKGDISASAVSGSVDISKFEGGLSASAVSGSVKGSDIMLTANSNFNSVSGSIEMNLLNPAEALSFELSTLSGSIVAKDKKGQSNLDIKKGAILIKGSTVSGSQEYK